jgi:hypothetical protein
MHDVIARNAGKTLGGALALITLAAVALRLVATGAAPPAPPTHRMAPTMIVAQPTVVHPVEGADSVSPSLLSGVDSPAALERTLAAPPTLTRTLPTVP